MKELVPLARLFFLGELRVLYCRRLGIVHVRHGSHSFIIKL